MQDDFSESIQNFVQGPLSSWISDHVVNLFVIFGACFFMWHFSNMTVERLVRRAVKRGNFDTERDEKLREDTLISLLSSIAKVAIWIIGLLLVISELGLTQRLAPIAAGAGLFGIIIGFGMQSLVRDMISGVFIVLENQYRVGDVVDIDGVPGTVVRISMRSTVLRDMDGNVHFIPNGNIQVATNKTLDFSKANVTLRLAVNTDLKKAEQVINAIGEHIAADEAWKSKIISAPKYMRITNFDEYAVEILISCKTVPSEQWAVSGELRGLLIKELAKHKINLAPPLFPGQVNPANKTAKKPVQ